MKLHPSAEVEVEEVVGRGGGGKRNWKGKALWQRRELAWAMAWMWCLCSRTSPCLGQMTVPFHGQVSSSASAGEREREREREREKKKKRKKE